MYDDGVSEDRDTTILIMHEMDDNYHRKSDNIDTQWLSIKVNLRVVSTVNPLDKTVTQLLHNKTITDETGANLAPAETEPIHFPAHLAKLCNTLLTKREDVIRRFYETMAPSLGHH